MTLLHNSPLKELHMRPDALFDHVHCRGESFVGGPEWQRYRAAWLTQYDGFVDHFSSTRWWLRDIATVALRVLGWITASAAAATALLSILIVFTLIGIDPKDLTAVGRNVPHSAGEFFGPVWSGFLILAIVVRGFLYPPNLRYPSAQRINKLMRDWSYHYWQSKGGVADLIEYVIER